MDYNSSNSTLASPTCSHALPLKIALLSMRLIIVMTFMLQVVTAVPFQKLTCLFFFSHFQCMGFQCMGFQCMGFQCMGFQCMGFQCMGFQCMGFQCMGFDSPEVRCYLKCCK